MQEKTAKPVGHTEARENEVAFADHANELNEPIPHVGQPLDGRHYLDVLEEQQHADEIPKLDGENRLHPDLGPRNAKLYEEPKPAQDEAP